MIVDVGTRTPSTTPDLSAAEVAGYGASGLLALQDRGEAVTAMAYAFARFLAQRDDIAGVIAISGSGGTAIVTAGRRALPVGVPKLMVSTLASGGSAPV